MAIMCCRKRPTSRTACANPISWTPTAIAGCRQCTRRRADARGWSEILAFMLAATLLVTSPGPNGVLIATTVSSSGRGAGFANIAGFFTAFYVHGALSILGISIILLKSATAFAVVKYLGAAYL